MSDADQRPPGLADAVAWVEETSHVVAQSLADHVRRSIADANHGPKNWQFTWVLVVAARSVDDVGQTIQPMAVCSPLTVDDRNEVLAAAVAIRPFKPKAQA